MRRAVTIILSFLGVLLVTAWQVAFFSNFNLFWAGFNLTLAVLVLLINVSRPTAVIFFVVLAGVVLDIYSSLSFGVYLLTLFLSAVILEVLFFNFFTNRSYYSLIFMGLIGSVIYSLLFVALSGFTYLVGLNNFFHLRDFWPSLFFQIIDVFLVLSLAYLIMDRLSRHFKTNFLYT